MLYCVYVLRSQVDGTTYIGYTSNLKKRLRDHDYGKTRSIKHKKPFDLIYFEAYVNSTLARKREIELKKNSSQKEDLFRRIFTAPSSNG